MIYTADEVLEMLYKAERLDIKHVITQIQGQKGWALHFQEQDKSVAVVVVPKANEDAWLYGGIQVRTYSDYLDIKIKERDQAQITEVKRQVALAKLTPEERELLGFKSE